jgi:hypothetical protein
VILGRLTRPGPGATFGHGDQAQGGPLAPGQVRSFHYLRKAQ